MSHSLIKNRIKFIPRLGAYLSRLEQKPPRALFSDAGALINALVRARKLFNLEALCVPIPPALIGHDLGCRGEWRPDGFHLTSSLPADLTPGAFQSPGRQGFTRTLLETLQGLKRLLPPSAGLIAALPGPRLLARHLPAPAPCPADCYLDGIMALARLCGELNALSAVFVAETFGEPAGDMSSLSADLNSICRLLSFFDLPAFLSPDVLDPETLNAADVRSAGFQGLILPAAAAMPDPGLKDVSIGYALPAAAFTAPMDIFKAQTAAILKNDPAFITTAGDIPMETGPERIHLLNSLTAARAPGRS
ncbi:MAG: hypothetical protein AB1427_10615 [Thermodesulfobacteriota bacterium]